MTSVDPTVEYKDWIEESLHTGSRVICDPAPTDTDDDYIILVKPELMEDFETRLYVDGWLLGGSAIKDLRPNLYEDGADTINRSGLFISFKRGDVNFICTVSRDYFTNFTLATALSKRLNLLKKEDRVTVFEALCFEVWPELE